MAGLTPGVNSPFAFYDPAGDKLSQIVRGQQAGQAAQAQQQAELQKIALEQTLRNVQPLADVAGGQFAVDALAGVGITGDASSTDALQQLGMAQQLTAIEGGQVEAGQRRDVSALESGTGLGPIEEQMSLAQIAAKPQGAAPKPDRMIEVDHTFRRPDGTSERRKIKLSVLEHKQYVADGYKLLGEPGYGEAQIAPPAEPQRVEINTPSGLLTGTYMTKGNKTYIVTDE